MRRLVASGKHGPAFVRDGLTMIRRLELSEMLIEARRLEAEVLRELPPTECASQCRQRAAELLRIADRADESGDSVVLWRVG
jgi:hypothetical protein